MDYIIRKRNKEDSKGISHVVTVGWNETYKGLVPDEELERLKQNEDERANNMEEAFDENNNKIIVLEIDNEVVGFAKYGISKDEEFENCGEIFALYIIGKYHGNGFGRRLVEEAIKELKKLGCDKMLISCLKGNPSNEFYKHIGGKHIKDEVYQRLSLPDNVYYFDI